MNRAEDIDWQHPEVVTKLVDTLLEETLDWRARARPSSTKEIDGPALLGALRYVGEKLDAFQMARYLEDNRHWGSDQELVYALRGAATWRESIIRDMKRKLNPTTAPEDRYQVGFRFSYGGGAYEITNIDRDLTHAYAVQRIGSSNGPSHHLSRDRLDELFDDGAKVLLRGY